MQASAYKHYVLGVLTVVLFFSYIDRVALGIVMQDLKAEFHLSDTQLGFLGGLAFALFYAVMGIPIARWADRGNRVTLIAVTTGLWSLAVALCAVAGNFAQLLLIRVGVAVGEAGCLPSGFALLADYFVRAERARAAVIYGLGSTAALVGGSFLGGWLNELYGWRVMFIILGLPGFALAAVVALTVKEPRYMRAVVTPGDAASPAKVAPSVAAPSLQAVGMRLWSNITLRHLVMCQAVVVFFNFGQGQWSPTFMIRSFGLASSEVGTWNALIAAVGGVLGVYLSAQWLSSRRAANNERLQLAAMAATLMACGVMTFLTYLCSNVYVFAALSTLTGAALTMVCGPLFGTIQTLVPENMRAVAFALLYLIANLLGMGLGPLAAGALSDGYRSWAGEESVRYALLTLAPGYFWVAWHAWRASCTVARDVEAAEAMEAVGAQ